LVARNEQLMIANVIEDEIILALPSIPRHESGECTVAEDVEKPQHDAEEGVEKAPNPFAVLAKLKAKH
jgi:uncharacterized protein